MNRIGANCGTRWSRARKIVSSLFHTNIYANRKEASKLLPALEFLSKYDEQTTQRILHVLNDTDNEKLSGYDVSKARVWNMAKYRQTNGPFASIEQVLEVDNFGVRVLEKLVGSIAAGSGKPAEPPVSKVYGKFLNIITTPVLYDEKRLAIKTMTGIVVGAEQISWAKVDTGGHLLRWDSYKVAEWPKRDTPMILHDVALKIRSKVPESDVYVMETAARSKVFMPNSFDTFLNLQRSQLIGMLGTLISTKFDSSNEDETARWTAVDNLYFIKQEAPALLFGLFVGKEKVAASDVVQQILDKTISRSLGYTPSVIIEQQREDIYNKSPPTKKEALSQALVLSVAFLDLVVKRNPLSLKTIHERTSKKCWN